MTRLLRTAVARHYGLEPTEVLDAYLDERPGQVVVRLTGYRRRRFTPPGTISPFMLPSERLTQALAA